MQALLRGSRASAICLTMAVAGCGLFGFAISRLMLGPSEIIGARLPELTCLQVAFTPERYAGVFLSFTPEAQLAIRALLIPGDIVFAWGYGLLLTGLLGLLVLRLQGGWRRAGAVLMWAPLLATVLDCIEDVFLHGMAGQLIADPTVAVAAAAAALAGAAATLKYIALALVAPGFGVAGIVRGLALDRSAGSLLLYAVLGLLLFSMVLRPLQQIPPCF